MDGSSTRLLKYLPTRVCKTPEECSTANQYEFYTGTQSDWNLDTIDANEDLYTCIDDSICIDVAGSTFRLIGAGTDVWTGAVNQSFKRCVSVCPVAQATDGINPNVYDTWGDIPSKRCYESCAYDLASGLTNVAVDFPGRHLDYDGLHTNTRRLLRDDDPLKRICVTPPECVLLGSMVSHFSGLQSQWSHDEKDIY